MRLPDQVMYQFVDCICLLIARCDHCDVIVPSFLKFHTEATNVLKTSSFNSRIAEIVVGAFPK